MTFKLAKAILFAAAPKQDFVGYFDTYTLQFVFPSVPPAKHKVKMQYRSLRAMLIKAGYRTLTVHFKD